VVRVTTFDVSGFLVELLFVRAVWKLPVAPEIPAPIPLPDVGTSARPANDDIEAQWSALWDQALVWEPAWPPSDAAPSWVIVQGTDGLDLTQLRGWSRSVRTGLASVISAQLTPDGKESRFGRRPYRDGRVRDADSRGVTVVSLLPVAGLFARWATPERIVVSAATFIDDKHWTAALDSAH